METVLIFVFVAGYVCIALERTLRIDKSAVALICGCVMWLLIAATGHFPGDIHEVLSGYLSPIAEIVFFLMGAMTIVEVIDGHRGFAFVTDRIRTRNKKVLFVLLGSVTFFLSAILDNLTTTIVMIAVMLKLVTDSKDKVLFTGIIIIAANAGGAFSPIGDVTTTMLWIGGQVSPGGIVSRLFAPSLVSFLIPLLVSLVFLKGELSEAIPVVNGQNTETAIPRWQRLAIFLFGIGALVAVPLFKNLTGLPPFMGILAALGLLWLVTEVFKGINDRENYRRLTVARALGEIDMASILFFVGVLLSVAALKHGGVLADVAGWLSKSIGDPAGIAISMGLFSSVFDNIPLVASAIQMYPLSQIPIDSGFWHLIAYAAGTGGSILIIGSAAGVTAMGSAKVGFGVYALRVGPLALLGYASGVAAYFIQSAIFPYR